MKPVLKGLWTDSPDFTLENYLPGDPGYFGLWIEMKIGPSDSDAADGFRLLVCSLEWIKNNHDWKSAFWGRHVLFLSSYDIAKMKSEIHKMIEACEESSWSKVARKISRFAAWEFEDYQT